MIKKQKKKSPLKIVFFVVLLIVLVALGVQYRVSVVRYWRFGMAVLERQGAYERALQLKHETLGIYCVAADAESAEECYLFDGKGMAFGRARTVVGDVIVRVEEQAATQPALGMPFVSAADWEHMLSILEAVRDKRLAASRLVLNRDNKEITAYVGQNGTPFYFSYAFNPQNHIEALPEFFKKVQLEGLQYADMRIENKIFYK